MLVGAGTTADESATTLQIWLTDDGIDWSLVHEMDQSIDEAPHGIGTGPEGFVAVGSTDWFINNEHAWALASADGRNWIEAPSSDPPLSDSAATYSVTALGNDWLAFPNRTDGQATALVSANGLDWSVGSTFALGDDYEPGQVPLLFGDGRFAIVSIGYGVDNAARSRLWISTDGVEWRPLEPTAIKGVMDTATHVDMAVLAVMTDGGIEVLTAATGA